MVGNRFFERGNSGMEGFFRFKVTYHWCRRWFRMGGKGRRKVACFVGRKRGGGEEVRTFCLETREMPAGSFASHTKTHVEAWRHRRGKKRKRDHRKLFFCFSIIAKCRRQGFPSGFGNSKVDLNCMSRKTNKFLLYCIRRCSGRSPTGWTWKRPSR